MMPPCAPLREIVNILTNMSFLAIDVGNTRLKWALYAQPLPGAALLAQGAVFLETIDDLAEGDWKSLPAPHSMLGSCVWITRTVKPFGWPASRSSARARSGLCGSSGTSVEPR